MFLENERICRDIKTKKSTGTRLGYGTLATKLNTTSK